MDARIIRRIDPQDTEVRELYRKGLRNYQGVGEPANPDGARSAVTPFGAILKYGGISKQDAYVLRRMLRSGPPVMRLCLYDMSLGAFRMAFDNVDECATLSSIYFHVDCQGKNLRTNFARVFSSLCSLDLRCDNPGSRFANDIASCIRNNKSLRELGVYNSCGGDEGAAVLIDTLWRNDTLKKFTLADMNLSCDVFIGFAKMLASNSTLELVDLTDVCSMEKRKVRSLLANECYAGVYKRLHVVWPVNLLSELTVLVRRQLCGPTLSVSVTSSVDESVLWKFFDAVAADKALRKIVFQSSEETFDGLAYGIASLVKRTKSLREIVNKMKVKRGKERQLIRVLRALKENSSIMDFTMSVDLVTPEIATSLSELLAENNALNDIQLCGESRVSHSELETILQGLRSNYTLTNLTLCSSNHGELGKRQVIDTLLRRNFELLEKAGNLVISGGHFFDEEGLYALKLVYSSAAFVEMLKFQTQKTTAETLKDIQATLTGLGVLGA